MKLNFTKSERIKLYEEVWSEPLSHVCKKYNISNTGLKQRCIKLQIPTPPPGYWTILKSVGQVAKKPPLPKYKGSHVFDDSKQLPDPFWQAIERQLTKSSENYKFEQLVKEASDWELAQKIRDYTVFVEMKVMVMRLPANQKSNIMERIKWAKKKADWIDPIIAYEDKYLGKRSFRRLFFDDDDTFFKW